MTESLSLVLFSGTDDRLTAAATMATGAAAMGRRVDVFLQFWALDAFRADRIEKDHGVVHEAGPEGAAALRRMGEKGGAHWSELFRQAKDIGELEITACAHSMEMLELERDDLDPLVTDVIGIAAYMARVDGPVVFI
ncbi:MAG TPA: DsrE/DsrF/DrsH-like family protein [Actinomycetota bacterium]